MTSLKKSSAGTKRPVNSVRISIGYQRGSGLETVNPKEVKDRYEKSFYGGAGCVRSKVY